MKKIIFFALIATFIIRAYCFGADLANHIYLVLEVPKTKVFVNEKIQIKAKLYSDWLDLENISLQQVQSEQLIIKKFGDRKISKINKDGVNFIVLEYSASFVAVTPGEYEIKPVEVKMDVARMKETAGQSAELLNDNKAHYYEFIGSGSSRSLLLASQPVKITVLPIPSGGQPADFEGAVGKFDLGIKAEPGSVKIGDTITLTISVTGEGNYDTVRIPRPGNMAGLRAFEPNISKSKDSVICEQKFLVESYDFKEIPAIALTFFNPDTAGYVSLQKGPLAIVVGGYAAKPESRPASQEKPKEEAVIVGLKESPGALRKYDTRFYASPALIILTAPPLIAVILAAGIRRRKNFLENNPQYAAMLRASKKAHKRIAKAEAFMKKGDVLAFYDAVFSVMQGYLGERALLPEEGITERIVDQISIKNLDEDMPKKIKKIFADCYVAKYASADINEASMKDTLGMVVHVIMYLDKEEFNV